MDIASELSVLAANKATIKAAIEAKNPEMAPGDDMSNWGTAIASIPEGGGGGGSGYVLLTPQTFSSADAAVSLVNRAINIITFTSAVENVTFTFPAKTSGVARDFFVRLIIEGTTPPDMSFVEPNGGGAVSFDANDSGWADIVSGVNILMFTDTAE